MPTTPLASLLGTFDFVTHRLLDRVAGLGADEYLWEPVADSWTVRRADDGRWTVDRATPDPEPAPVTTIAWRLWHIASDCLAGYVTPHLGEWPLQVRQQGREWYADPAPALDELRTALRVFRERVAQLGEDGIWARLGEQWGPYADDTWYDLGLHALDEVVHHGAEIALLRDLYARR